MAQAPFVRSLGAITLLLAGGLAGCADLPGGSKDCGSAERVDTGDSWRGQVQPFTEGLEHWYLLTATTPSDACEKQHVKFNAHARVADAAAAGCEDATAPRYRVSWNHEGFGDEVNLPASPGAADNTTFMTYLGEVGLAQHDEPVSLSVSAIVIFPSKGTPAQDQACHLARITSMQVWFEYLKPRGAGTG